MAFKKVGNGSFKYVKYAECEQGAVIATGTYLGPKQGTYGTQHQFREDSGDVTVLNSSGHLNFLLENHVSKGDYTQVTYAGTAIMSKGKFKGKEMHQFEVGVDTDRARDESAAPVETPSKSASDDEDEDELTEETEELDDAPPAKNAKTAKAVEADDDEEAPAPAKAKPAAAAPAAAKGKMSSDELLNKYRNKKGA